MKGAAGIEQYHAADCPARNGAGRCQRLKCSYRASVYNRFTGKQDKSKRLPTLEKAKEWQRNHQAELRLRRNAGPTPTTTFDDAWPVWLAKARAGGILARGDKAYKPRPLDDYDRSMRLHVLPDYGGNQLAEVSTEGLQRLVSELMATSSPSKVRNTINPIRALYRDAALIVPGWNGHDPTDGLKLPKVNSRRSEERMPTPEQVAALITAAPDDDRGVWATAGLAGLRLGEIQALRWRDVDLGKSVIHVRRSYQGRHGFGDVKSDAGARDVPIFAALKPPLEALKAGKPDDLLFPAKRAAAFHPGKMQDRADAAWKKADVARFTLHELRHGAASVWIEAGVIPRRVQRWLGHADIGTTFAIYGKLLDRSEPESVSKVDSYLASVGPAMGSTDADESGSERLASSPEPVAA